MQPFARKSVVQEMKMLHLAVDSNSLHAGVDLHKAATADAGIGALGYLLRMHGMKRTGWMGWLSLAYRYL